MDAVQANARKHASVRRRARRRRDLTYEKRREDAFEWGLDHAGLAVYDFPGHWDLIVCRTCLFRPL